MFGRYFATEKALTCIPNDHRKFANLTKCLFGLSFDSFELSTANALCSP